MQLLSVVPDLVTLVVSLADEVPEAEDVKAGWLAFGIFIGLGVAVAILGVSLFRHLRKAQPAEEAGIYAPSARSSAQQAPADADGDATDQRP